MKTGILVAVAAIVAFAVAGSFSSVWGGPQQDSPKKGREKPTSPIPPEAKTQSQKGEMGAMDDLIMMDHMTVVMQVDSMMQRMTMLMERTSSYSKSFGLLAATHHGADKSEILMMQRMSDSMGTMAGEIKANLQRYKDMLDDETTSESVNVKVEVQSLKGSLDSIARDVEKAVNTLQTIQEGLGQG